MKYLYLTALLSNFIMFSTSAFSKEEFIENEVFGMTLEELLNVDVITASKTLEDKWSAPSVMTVFTKEEIKLFGSRNIADVLAKIVGMQPYFNAVYGLSYLSVRGDTTSAIDARTLVLLDGRPSFRNSIAHSSNIIPYTLFPLESLQRIEVIRGPGSVLYGTGAFSSVINLITEKTHKPIANVTLSRGSFNTNDGTIDLGYGEENWSFRTTTRFIDKDGDDFTAIGEDGLLSEQSYYENDNYLSHNKLNWGNFDLSFVQSKSDRMTWFPSIKTNQNKAHRFENRLTSLNARYKWPISDSLSIELNSSYRSEHLFNTYDEAQTVNEENTLDNHGLSKDYSYELTAFGEVNDLSLNYVFGMVHDRSTGTDKADSNDPYSIPIFAPERWDYQIDSIYFQTSYSYGGNLSFTVGAQYNKPDFSAGNLSPRFGIVGNYDSGFGFKMLYGESFRAPIAAERFVIGSRVQGNTELENELIATTELQFSHHTNNSELAITIYNSQLTELITTIPIDDTNTLVQFANQGKRILNGIELEGKLNFYSSWYLSGNYSWQENKTDGTYGTTLQPRWLFNLGIGKKTSKYHFSLFDTVTSPYGEVERVNPRVMNVNPKSETYHLLSGSASWYFTPNGIMESDIELSISIHNILDEEVYVPDYSTHNLNTIPGAPGRSFLVSVNLGFN